MSDASISLAGGTRELITFLVRSQEFCIDVMAVREIRVWTPTTPLAHAPHFVCGVINLRGKVLPIIDFAARLGMAPTEATTRHAILVVQVRDQLLGLLVEGVSEILTIQDGAVQPTPDVATVAAKEFIAGIIAMEGRMLSLVILDAMIAEMSQAMAA